MRRTAVSVLAALTAFWMSAADSFAQRVVGTHPGTIASLALSPDGKTLASGGEGGTIQLWRYSTGTLIRTLDGHHAEVDWMRFWPDSRYLVSVSFGRLQAHDLKTGERLPISDQLGLLLGCRPVPGPDNDRRLRLFQRFEHMGFDVGGDEGEIGECRRSSRFAGLFT